MRGQGIGQHRRNALPLRMQPWLAAYAQPGKTKKKTSDCDAFWPMKPVPQAFPILSALTVTARHSNEQAFFQHTECVFKAGMIKLIKLIKLIQLLQAPFMPYRARV